MLGLSVRSSATECQRCLFKGVVFVLKVMTRRILVPMDGSAMAEEGLRYAVSAFPDASIIVMHVITPFDDWEIEEEGPASGDVDEWFESSRGNASEIFESAELIAASHDMEISTVLEIGEPWREIVKFAQENEIGQIVMGSQGESGNAEGLGSVAETVMRRSPVLVSIVR